MLTTEVDRIQVAVGIVYDDQGRILIGQRTVPDLYFGKWEFPGGKIRTNESADQALKRELAEEIGIQVRHCDPFLEFPFDYKDRKVQLNFRIVRDYDGIPQACEAQALMWVVPSSLHEIDMLEANTIVIEEIDRLSITPASKLQQT